MLTNCCCKEIRVGLRNIKGCLMTDWFVISFAFEEYFLSVSELTSLCKNLFLSIVKLGRKDMNLVTTTSTLEWIISCSFNRYLDWRCHLNRGWVYIIAGNSWFKTFKVLGVTSVWSASKVKTTKYIKVILFRIFLNNRTPKTNRTIYIQV